MTSPVYHREGILLEFSRSVFGGETTEQIAALWEKLAEGATIRTLTGSVDTALPER